MANVTDRNACYDGLRQQLLKPPLRSAIAMSALGQKQTYAVQQSMSALPPIATAKADMRFMFSNCFCSRSERSPALVLHLFGAFCRTVPLLRFSGHRLTSLK